MHTRDDFADASLDAGLVAKLGNIFPTFADDNTCVFGADECTKSEEILGQRRLRGRAGGRGRGSWRIRDQGRRRKQKKRIKTLLKGAGRGGGHRTKINDKW